MRNIIYLKSAYKSMSDYEKDTRKRIIEAIVKSYKERNIRHCSD